MKQEYRMTQESLDKLKEEQEYLSTVRMREITAQIKEAFLSATFPKTQSTMQQRMSRAR